MKRSVSGKPAHTTRKEKDRHYDAGPKRSFKIDYGMLIGSAIGGLLGSEIVNRPESFDVLKEPVQVLVSHLEEMQRSVMSASREKALMLSFVKRNEGNRASQIWSCLDKGHHLLPDIKHCLHGHAPKAAPAPRKTHS